MKEEIKNKLSAFPRESGVYFFKDHDERIVYIGKARDLWKRMRSYIYGQDSRPMISLLLKIIDDCDFIVTKNEKEALVLENNLIKKHRPLYNIDLKDDKTFYNIMIDVSHKFPSVRLVRQVDIKKGKHYFGPYHSATEIKQLIKFLTGVFPIRTCTDTFFKTRKRPCIKYEIEKCTGPCCGKISREKYDFLVLQFEDFLKGKNKKIAAKMKADIKTFSKELKFEDAAKLHKRLQALLGMFEKQSAVLLKKIDIDVCGTAVNLDKTAFVIQILHIRNGALISQEKKFFRQRIDEITDVLETFFYNYYKSYPMPPSLVLIPHKINHSILTDELENIHEKNIKFVVPLKGVKKELLDMANNNASLKLKETLDEKARFEKLKNKMKNKLSLKNTPNTMECFDVSSIQGDDSVASKVQFKDFLPFKSGYRKYSLENIKTNDDYLKISTAIKRRVLKKTGNDAYPDLIIIDGGYGHLQIVLKTLKAFDNDTFPFDVISIAKDKSKKGIKEDKVYISARKNPIVFQVFEKDILFQIMKIRDEAHRFAIEYHRLKRKKRMFGEDS
ncbi:MAG: excinuclease ABC subunit UvrC [Candidatus Aureabacteria bacterium]|nr:excinuclease ABC subunit UvrC [Candidatus Auribacterota bacterium]